MNPWKDGTFKDITQPLPMEEATPDNTEATEGTEDTPKRPTKEQDAVIMHSLYEDTGVDAFCDKDTREIYAIFPVDGLHNETWPIRSDRFISWSQSCFFNAQERTIGKSCIESAIGLLSNKAYSKICKTFTRTARKNGKIYIDLCNENHEVIEIGRDKKSYWRIIQNPPVIFLRSPSMQALPHPQEGKKLNLLREFINVDDDGFIILCGWLIAAACPDIPYPVLVLSGEAGSGKSTSTAILQRVLDPNAVERPGQCKDEEALLVTAKGRWIVPCDNISKINGEESDSLCRLSTGGGFSTRKHYTNGEAFGMSVKRPVILNGIALEASKHDLRERAWRVQLKSLYGKHGLEADLWARFDKAHPLILGALCTALACMLANENKNPEVSFTRMVDAATCVMRGELGAGTPWDRSVSFADVLTRMEADKRDDAIQEDYVAWFVCNLVDKLGNYEDTVKNLLWRISDAARDDGRRDVPQSPKMLGIRLENIKPILNRKGIELHKKRASSGVVYTFNRI